MINKVVNAVPQIARGPCYMHEKDGRTRGATAECNCGTVSELWLICQSERSVLLNGTADNTILLWTELLAVPLYFNPRIKTGDS